MKVKSLLIIASVFLSLTSLQAQTNHKGNVKGIVADTGKAGLESVTVILLTPQDSSYVSGTITNSNGEFELNAPTGSYLIEASMLGYQKRYKELFMPSHHSLQLDTLYLQEDDHLLSEVVITAQKQLIEFEAGKTVINLASSPISSQGNLLDALKNLPGVMIDSNGSIYLNGQQGIHVLINDKPTYLSGDALMNLLRSISATSVGKIELVSHPSSQFDAAGNSGLINIQTQKEKIQGIGLSVSSGIKSGRYLSGNESASLSIRKNKVNFRADYSLYWGEDYTTLRTGAVRDLLENPGLPPQNQTLDMSAKRYTDYLSHYIRSGLDYEFSPKLNVGFYGSYNWRDWNRDERTLSDFTREDNTPDPTLISDTNFHKDNKNLTGGVIVSYHPNEKSLWETSFDFQKFDQTNQMLQYSSPEQIVQRDTLRGAAQGDVQIYAVQSNFKNELSERSKLTVGVKAAFVSNDNTALYQDMHNGTYVDNSQLSNNFFYDENVYASYIQINSQWSPKISAEAGLRLEHTTVKGVQESLKKDSAFRQNYTHLFPTCMITYQLSSHQKLAFIYSRRIVRPNYRDLNPFIEINDRYLQEQGNTGLKPELADNIELSYFFKNKWAVSLLYSYRKHPITKSYLTGDEDVTIVTPCNLSFNYLAGIKIGINNLRPFSWWTTHINSSIMHKRFQWNMFDRLDTNKKTTPMVHLSNHLSFPNNWQAEISGFYNGQMAEGQAKSHTIWQVSAGIRKSFLKNKASLQLYANDIFSSYRASFNIYSPLMQAWYKENNDTRTVGLTFTYRFNSGAKTKDTYRESRMDESKRINL